MPYTQKLMNPQAMKATIPEALKTPTPLNTETKSYRY